MISVIIPAYNSAATVVQALDSVVAQTFSDWEVIVVDDRSTDDTAAIVEAWIRGRNEGSHRGSGPDFHPPPSTLHPRFLLLRLEDNAGPAAARNRGIELARGEWLAFLDADDAWLPQRLETQMRFVSNHPEVALLCGLTERLGEEASLHPPPATLDPSVPFRLLSLEEFAVHNPVATSTVLVRRSAVNDAGGFDPRFRGPEDYDLWMRIASRYAMAILDMPLALYRHRPGSLSLDERRFLPQVLRVLDKAFGPDGALSGHPELRRRSVANQYWNAAWMAFNRGSRGTALRYLVRAVALDRRVGGTLKSRVLWRYLFGKPE